MDLENGREIADIATGTLHNVMNILNTVAVSLRVATGRTMEQPIEQYKKASRMLAENLDRLDQFVLTDPKGPKLMEYFVKFAQVLEADTRELREEMTKIQGMIGSIVEIVAAQQRYAGTSKIEEVSPKRVVEDALTLQSTFLARHEIRVVRDFEQTPSVRVSKIKLFHVLVNLIKNGSEAMTAQPQRQRELTVSTRHGEDKVRIHVRDTGLGISEEVMGRIFSHGFTTKQDGHGFGLHSCKNYVEGMDGRIWAVSDGPGQGAVFSIELPVANR